VHLVLTQMTFSRRNLLVAGRYALVVLAFCGLLVKAFSALQTFDPLPGVGRVKPTETPVFVDPKHLSAVMAIHPKCLYTESSLAEMRKILARMPEEITVTLLEFSADGEKESWTTNAAAELSALSKMQARILIDANGEMAQALGITKSGQLKLFSPNGKILFDGGVVAGFGTTGFSGSEELIVDIISGSAFKPVFTSNFGCKLFDQPDCETTALAMAHN
jgi:hypothetical protein